MNKLITHIILLFVTSTFAYGQNLYDHKLNKDKWQNIKKNIQYNEKEPLKPWAFENQKAYQKALDKYNERKKGNGISNGTGENGASKAQKDIVEYKEPDYDPSIQIPTFSKSTISGLGTLGWIIIIVILTALIVLIIYAIVKNGNSGNKKVNLSNLIENDEIAPSEIPLTELQRLLKEALDKADYRAAVRIYYLFILKDLSHKKWIFWEKEKTNMHYLREMSGKAEFNDFNKAISYFEVIWYGKRDINQNQFYNIQPNFTNFLDKLGVK